MKLKRPFSDEEFQATPEPVRRYIIQLEEVVIKLFKETQDLKKRVTELENRLNKNSQNSSKPPSSDPPYHGVLLCKFCFFYPSMTLSFCSFECQVGIFFGDLGVSFPTSPPGPLSNIGEGKKSHPTTKHWQHTKRL